MKKFHRAVIVISIVLLSISYLRSDTGFGLSTIFTLDTRTVGSLGQLTNGPSISSIDVPENGTGYLYLDFTSGENLISGSETTIVLTKSGSGTVSAAGTFIDKGILRIAVPASALGSNSSETFTLPGSIQVGDTLFTISGTPLTFTANKKPLSFLRTWDIFAGGSAGVSGSVSGSVGSVGLVVSVAAAKLSVKGEGGAGIKIELDENGYLTLDRRMEAGIGVEAKAPSVNLVVGEVYVGRAGVTAKKLIGQRYRFTDLQLDEDTKKMAQTGFILETLSLGGVGLSPPVGLIINAVVNTLNDLGGVSSIFDDAKVSDYWGLGAEGSISAGVSSEFKIGTKLTLTPVEASAGLALKAVHYNRYRDETAGFAKFAHSNALTGTGWTVDLGASFDFSLLSLGFNNNDGMELSSGNLTLFDAGAGGEVGYAINKSITGEVTGLSLNLKGGGDASVFGAERSTYYSTRLDFQPDHISTILSSASSGISSLVSGINVQFGPQTMAANAIAAMDEVLAAAGSTPVRLTTVESRGRGLNLNIGIDLEAALGVGLGISLGVNGQYYDEIEFPKKVTDVYIGRNNFLLSSAEYTSEMEAASFKDILNELFSGAVPLIKNAYLNLVNIVRNVVVSGEEFVMVALATTQKKVGEIKGTVQQAGEFVLSIFSPNSPRVLQKAFMPPEVKYAYFSKDVLHKVAGANNSVRLEAVETTLFIVSDAMSIGFVPAGGTSTVDMLEKSVNLKMIIDEQKLVDSDFTVDDKDKVKIYYYDQDSLSWILEGGSASDDTISVSIKKMGSYALGIEVTKTTDTIKPEIKEVGPGPGIIYDNTPEIYALISDDRFGTGVDLSRSFILLDGHTLDTSYDPTSEKLFYQVTEKDTLKRATYTVHVIVADFADNVATTIFEFQVEVTGVEDEVNIPEDFVLHQNFPNPFNSSTTIRYTLAISGTVEINIYDVTGRFIRNLVSGFSAQGSHSVVWDGKNASGSDVSSGIYFYQLRAADFNFVKRMQLIK